MTRIMAVVGTAVLLSFHATSELEAQLWEAARPGEDRASLAVQGGLLQPNTTYDDGSSFDAGVGVGLTTSYWVFRNVGLRSSLFRSRTEGRAGEEFSPVGLQNPTVWLYNLELALRLPVAGDRLGGFPYLAAGYGGKTYRWDPSWPEQIGFTSGAWTAAGGIELRSIGGSPFGLIGEVRNYWYGYSGFQYQWGSGIGRHINDPQDSSDLMFTAGVTISR